MGLAPESAVSTSLWSEFVRMALDAKFPLGVIPHEFVEGRSVRIMAAVAGHDPAGPRINDIIAQGVIDVFPVGMAAQADFLRVLPDRGRVRDAQVGVVAGGAVLVIDQRMAGSGQFVGGCFFLVTGTAQVHLLPRQQGERGRGMRGMAGSTRILAKQGSVGNTQFEVLFHSLMAGEAKRWLGLHESCRRPHMAGAAIPVCEGGVDLLMGQVGALGRVRGVAGSAVGAFHGEPPVLGVQFAGFGDMALRAEILGFGFEAHGRLAAMGIVAEGALALPERFVDV